MSSDFYKRRIALSKADRCPDGEVVERSIDSYFYDDGNKVDIPLVPTTLDAMQLEQAASQLEALGNPTRLAIYRALVRAGANGMPVGKLQTQLDVAPSTLSHHLRKLVEVQLMSQERQATTLICRANYESMNALLGYLSDECCVDAQDPRETAAA